MKINRIKEKLDELLGVTPSKEESTKKSLNNIEKIIHQLKEKEAKFQEKLTTSTDEEDTQKIKLKLKLIKKQLTKASDYKQGIE